MSFTWGWGIGVAGGGDAPVDATPGGEDMVLLLETGDALLLEDGDNILLEEDT